MQALEIYFYVDTIVNVRNIQTCREFLWVCLRQTDDNRQKQNFNELRKCFREYDTMELYHILSIKIKRIGISGLSEIHWWLSREVGGSKGGGTSRIK